MASKQVQKLLGQLVEHQDVFEDMSSKDRQWVIRNTKTALGLFAASIHQYAHGSQSDRSSLGDVVRSHFVTVMAEFEASAVQKFDLTRHFINGRSQAARSAQFLTHESDVPARTLKVLRLKGREGLPLELICAMGYNPLVHLAHVYEFGKAWDQGRIQWFDEEPQKKSLGFVLRVNEDVSVNCYINRAHGNSDSGKDWFLGCESGGFEFDQLKQARQYHESLILVS